MRRHEASRSERPAAAGAAAAAEECKFPSNAVIDVFGRLFGVILATLLEGRVNDFGSLSAVQDELRTPLRDIFRCFDISRKQDDPRSSGRVVEPAEDSVEELKSEERELNELKRRLCEVSRSTGSHCERTFDLISHSTPFFEAGGHFDYHILPFGNRPVFEGLICYLNERCGGNAHDKGLIRVTVSSCAGGQPQNVVDLQTDSPFISPNATDQWLCYDFKDMRVAMTHYILRSNDTGVGGQHLRSWVIEGSEDNCHWTELDRQSSGGSSGGSLNGPKAACPFEVRNVVLCRFIRLRSTGPNWYGDNYVYFLAFDVFGGLRVPDSVKLT
jgi:hypothetical protein